MTHTTTVGYATIGDGRLYYEIAGQGETVVLAHTAIVDSGMWDTQVDALAQHYRVIRFDARGFGKSDAATAPLSRREDLRRLLDALGVERVHLVGCSMGGENVLDFALETPERVRSLTLISAVPSGMPIEGEPPRYLMDMFAALEQGDFARAAELQVRISVDGPFREPDEVNADVRAQVAAMNRIAVENGTFAIDMEPLNPLDPPAFTRLADVRVPTLVIVGAQDDPLLLNAADVLTSGITGASEVVIPNSAHLQNMEQPTLFNDALLGFLRGTAD